MKKNIRIPKHRRIGLLVLAFLIVVVLGIKTYIAYWYTPTQVVGDIEPKLVLDTTSVKESKHVTDKVDLSGIKINIHTAPFDSLVLIGIPKYPARNIVKYRKMGGSIYSKTKLAEIYGMKPSVLNRVVPYIDFSRKIPRKERIKQPQYTKTAPQKSPIDTVYRARRVDTFARKERDDRPKYKRTYIPDIVDINTADTLDLKKLKGIGSYLSKSIVRYRQKLGGYHSIAQLKEIRNLRASTYEKILPFVTIDTKIVQKLSINQASEKELARHPYISRKLARVLVNYRKNHGLYTRIDDLQKIKIIQEEVLEKLQPYLLFD